MIQNPKNRIINIKRLLLAIAFVLVVAFIGLYIWMQDQYVVPILMYHSVSSKNTNPVNILYRTRGTKLQLNIVSPVLFAKQMDFLEKNGYQVISLDDFVKGNNLRQKFPHNTVVITFDDGYVDNYENAYPILKKHHFPATIFLISDFVGISPNLLDWPQAQEMSKNGIDFGSHTRHHAYLPDLSKEQLKDEIVESKRIIEKNLGKPIFYISYPIGGFSEQAKEIAALAGYKAALATNRGYDRYNIDSFELNRIHVNNWDNDITFRTKLSGYYNLFRKLKSSQ